MRGVPHRVLSKTSAAIYLAISPAHQYCADKKTKSAKNNKFCEIVGHGFTQGIVGVSMRKEHLGRHPGVGPRFM